MATGQQVRRTSPWVLRAWLSAALIPLVLVGVSWAALLFFRETRYEAGEHYRPEWVDGMPWWAALLQALISIAIFSVPCLMAWWCGRRATREGDARGRRPQLVGLLSLAGYALLVLTSALRNLV